MRTLWRTIVVIDDFPRYIDTKVVGVHLYSRTRLSWTLAAYTYSLNVLGGHVDWAARSIGGGTAPATKLHDTATAATTTVDSWACTSASSTTAAPSAHGPEGLAVSVE